ncbi:MAG: 50S ribosomal protein L6 [Candidatus Neomarinimicrobiota bacterium]|nr:50S ribosomal protein L6 [Candidatus Neomarinimicrobiota bacterium]RKY48023.1 MAG: 50S ribosomal protein L6 [Candidatus Neomarinimicrobiota bacterium]RKY48672.1 MAG: 50S ribosomal protein L6 [Candidatus Neomarinimicrobiota bacterium]RKY54550.1 MAG: 50S ribosomal protein L6 [Candidatus Neomarinimicrobiota bacterium]
MSRIGRKPIDIPQGVMVEVSGQHVRVKGPKGELELDVHPDMIVEKKDNQVLVNRPTDNKRHRALHGLTRMLIANMIEGVTKGYQKTLLLEGIGYSVEMKGKSLLLNVGYSHPVLFTPPEGIKIEVPKALTIVVSGIDKQKVGQVAAMIRSIRPVEPYKGKGIRYEGEYVRRKAGKKVGAK